MAAGADPASYRADWRRHGLVSWLATADHKRIGILYIWTALVFLALGGILALLLRTELATPDADVLTQHSYSQVLTIHGTTMIFLALLPLLVGLANYLVPLMIGARRMAFPRLNAVGYWLFMFGGVVLYLSFLAKGGPASTGWTAYAPLSTLHSTGNGQDAWILGLHLVAIGFLAAAINLVATIHTYRVRGMTWMRTPLFVWSVLVYGWLLVVTLPVFGAVLTMLELDRKGVTDFFDPAKGGSPNLYQHLFWFGAHPLVYGLILPAAGIVSEIVQVFSRKPIAGYRAVVYATIAIAALSMLGWGEHLFATDLPTVFEVLVIVATLALAVPAAVLIFNWLATLRHGSIAFDTPMLWALGFIAMVAIGAVSGILLALFTVDWELTDTVFVVAHLHFMLFGGALFAVFAGLTYWWPKLFGRMLDEKLGKLHFWLVLVGFNLAVFPQFLLGVYGMPRRTSAYDPDSGWEALQMVSMIGSMVIALGMLVFVTNVVKTGRSGRRVGQDPWRADTLEWYAASPPSEWNFDRIPQVGSARPLSDLRGRLAEGRR